MKMTKLLSVFLAALMLFSCVAGALATGVAAGETEGGEYQFSYTDPRETATKVITYYADIDTEGYNIPEGSIHAGSIIGALCANAYRTTWPAGSVLVVKFDTDENPIVDANLSNSGLGRSEHLLFGCATIFREDGTKLPIVIEPIDDNSTFTFTSGTKNLFAANDYYITNVTFVRGPHTDGTYKDFGIGAGSGLVVLDNVSFDSVDGNNAGKFKFWGDAYSSDSFFKWTDEKLAINANEEGLLETGIVFGQNTSFNFGTKTAPRIAVVGADGHSGSSAYKATYLPTSDKTGLTDAAVDATTTAAGNVKFSNGLILTSNANCVVKPTDLDAKIIIDTGNFGTEQDFAHISVRAGCSPVAKSSIIAYSGNIASISPDTATGSTATREIYSGDISIELRGANVGNTEKGTESGSTYVVGFTYAFLLGNYNVTVTDGTISRINGTEGNLAAAAITGNYTFNMSGGSVYTYYGATPIYGTTGTNTNNVSGGTIVSYAGARFDVEEVVNNISGGKFTYIYCGSYGSTNTTQKITNNISGHYNDCQFTEKFIAGNRTAANNTGLTITTNIAGGYFHKEIDKGNSVNATLNILSDSADDEIKLMNYTYDFDSFVMNGGIIHFEETKFTANSAAGAVILRNIGNWSETDKYSFLFKDAVNKLDVITAQEGTDETNVGKVVEIGNDITVTYGFAPLPTISPVGAVLVMEPESTAFGIRFVFEKADIEGLSSFYYEVKLGEELIPNSQVILESYMGYYSLTLYNIGLEDMNKKVTFGGNVTGIEGVDFTLAYVADLGTTQFTGDWQNWAKALQNLNNVHNLGLECATGADLAKAYEKYTVSFGSLFDDISGLTAYFLMSNVTGIRFTTTFGTAPTSLVITVNGEDVTSKAVTEGNVLILDLELPAQEMEKAITVEVMNGTDSYYTFNGSAARLAQEAATTNNDSAAQAFLWYIQAAAAVAV